MVRRSPPAPIFGKFSTDPEFAAFFKFVNQLRAIVGVREIRFATTGEMVHLWLLTPTEDLAANREVFALERAFREEQRQVSLELHLVPMSDVDVNDLPPAEVLASAAG